MKKKRVFFLIIYTLTGLQIKFSLKNVHIFFCALNEEIKILPARSLFTNNWLYIELIMNPVNWSTFLLLWIAYGLWKHPKILSISIHREITKKWIRLLGDAQNGTLVMPIFGLDRLSSELVRRCCTSLFWVTDLDPYWFSWPLLLLLRRPVYVFTCCGVLWSISYTKNIFFSLWTIFPIPPPPGFFSLFFWELVY